MAHFIERVMAHAMCARYVRIDLGTWITVCVELA